jgi:hypothetical protein
MARLGTVVDDDPGEQLMACLWLRQVRPAPLEASVGGFAEGSGDTVPQRCSVTGAIEPGGRFGGPVRKQGRSVGDRFRLRRSRHRSSRSRNDHGNDLRPGIYWHRWGFLVLSSNAPAVFVDRPGVRVATALSGSAS